MRVVVTGAAGFIGSRLVHELVRLGRLRDGSGHERAITELMLLDRTAIDLPGLNLPANASRIAIRCASGELSDAAFMARCLGEASLDSLFHLAAMLTSAAEHDFEQGLAVNVLGLLDILGHCRRQGRSPKLIFASSIATFGGALPDLVEDDTAQKPQTSYGAHKAIAELLLDDHNRHGLLDGRALRLPIVLTRPGKPAASVSDRVAGILREPLRGEPVACPLTPETWLPVVSVGAVVRGLITLHDLPPEAFGDSRALNLPALSVTVAMMIECLRRHAASLPAGHRLGTIGWAPDPAMQRIVDSWPKRFDSARARRLGILPDADLDAVLQDFLVNGGLSHE